MHQFKTFLIQYS